MTKQQYRNCRILTAICLSLIVGWSINSGKGLISAIAILIASFVLLQCRKKVKDILFDERDLKIVGKSTRVSISIFGIGGALASLLFMNFEYLNPDFYVIGQTTAFLVCLLLIVNNVVYLYYNRKIKENAK